MSNISENLMVTKGGFVYKIIKLTIYETACCPWNCALKFIIFSKLHIFEKMPGNSWDIIVYVYVEHVWHTIFNVYRFSLVLQIFH